MSAFPFGAPDADALARPAPTLPPAPKAITVAMLKAGIATLLATTKTVSEVEGKGKDQKTVTRIVHETDPPATFREVRGGPKRPGPLPTLLDEVPEKATARECEHTHFHDPEADPAEGVRHFARHAVLEARRIGARSVVVADVSCSSSATTIDWVLVF